MVFWPAPFVLFCGLTSFTNFAEMHTCVWINRKLQFYQIFITLALKCLQLVLCCYNEKASMHLGECVQKALKNVPCIVDILSWQKNCSISLSLSLWSYIFIFFFSFPKWLMLCVIFAECGWRERSDLDEDSSKTSN